VRKGADKGHLGDGLLGARGHVGQDVQHVQLGVLVGFALVFLVEQQRDQPLQRVVIEKLVRVAPGHRHKRRQIHRPRQERGVQLPFRREVHVFLRGGHNFRACLSSFYVGQIVVDLLLAPSIPMREYGVWCGQRRGRRIAVAVTAVTAVFFR